MLPYAGDAGDRPTPAHEAVFECWTVMAALAEATTTIRLGQMVRCTSYRAPALTAKITATIDVISGGRLDWGGSAPAGRRVSTSPEVFVRETEVEIRELVAAGRAGSKLGEPFDSYAAGNLIGTPEQVAERIRAYADLGCTCVVPWCADHPDDTTLRLFAEQVMPELR